MVTGLVTVNGNNQGCQLREHKEKNTAQPYGSDRNHTTPHANKTINALQQLEKEHARTIGYYEPITMILDHHAFSPKLSTRALVSLGGPPESFSDDLSRISG